MSESKYLGVTPPISLNPSSAEEEAISLELLAALEAEGQFESVDESRNREVVLGKIDKLVKEFVYKASLKHRMSESLARSCGGKIFAFGSFRLGVHNTGADIDTLCVAPSHVTREDFFTIMVDLLKGRSEVDELTPVPSAYVPVIKMRFGGVEIDLTFASLQQPTIPDELELLDTAILRNLDEFSIRSVNGSRVTDEILRLVPNVTSFRLALRCIKLWAKRRAIYSNSMGFFGGVAWAMLVARVCQLYPNACAGSIVAGFFRVYVKWPWPKPVMLKMIENGTMHLRVWNPWIYPADKAHKMPIITPAYPSMCSTHNVSMSTKRIIESEFKRGEEITTKILQGEAKWTELFEKSDFFRRYRYYLQVNVMSTDVESHNLLHGFVESRLRQYIIKLESTGLVVVACPYVKSYDHEYACKSDEDLERIRQGQLPTTPTASDTPDPTTVVDKGSEPKQDDGSSSPVAGTEKKAFTSAFYVGLLLDKEIGRNSNGKRRLDISGPTHDFIGLITGWDTWSNEGMAISISFLRQSQLPDEVFDGLPRDRVPSTLKNGSAKSKKRREQGKEDGASATDRSAKKAKVAMAVVPSTSGVAVVVAEPAAKTDDVEKEKDAEDVPKPSVVATGFAAIAAPVPPPPKQAGIKLKLL
ncbi:polynucleotide adenylyltransferase [Coemansia aciculifera]|uniref:Poly(A) polymerase n=1 Tax=Coemansia aciculifera TaxID=417176 RepID=A0A9W8IM15_9FUNG|nr:polynucleotide adenylyltransferase [Coemansia aciculifera]